MKDPNIQEGYYTRCFKRGYLILKFNFAALNVSVEFRDLWTSSAPSLFLFSSGREMTAAYFSRTAGVSF